MAHRFAEQRVRWFEEPVSSDDLEGLAWRRDRAPAGMAITAGEYAYLPIDLLRTVQHVGVLQADATRCLGITGLLLAGALAEAYGIPLSTHTAQSLHTHPACAIARMIHVEHFHDHARVERTLFDGVPDLIHGCLAPDLSRPGNGLVLRAEARASHAGRISSTRP
jgi:L-alanine-DL-glutamate epimerase-like enolase superfamily enzyme